MLDIFEHRYLKKRAPQLPSKFIRPIHPKTEIQPRQDAIERILNRGWVAQPKIHGHRCQIHLVADESSAPLAFNRNGQFHKKELSPEIVSELYRLFSLKEGWTVLDGEWLKPSNKLYLFDILKKDNVLLKDKSFEERYAELPSDQISPHIQVLPVFRTVDRCLESLNKEDSHYEGLVFRAAQTPGFSDTSIVRCRKKNPHSL